MIIISWVPVVDVLERTKIILERYQKVILISGFPESVYIILAVCDFFIIYQSVVKICWLKNWEDIIG